MSRDDVAQFRGNLEKHLRDSYDVEEKRRIDEDRKRSEANVKRIIENCGGKNPILGY